MVLSRDNFDQFETPANSFDSLLSEKGFDGRQIRNIVTSAMGFARGVDSQHMSIKHIKKVVSYVEDFQKDLAGQMYKWSEAQKGASLRPE